MCFVLFFKCLSALNLKHSFTEPECAISLFVICFVFVLQPRKFQRVHHILVERRIREVPTERQQLQALTSGRLLGIVKQQEGKGSAGIGEKSPGNVAGQ